MTPISVQPEKEQKTLWIMGWAITFILVLIALIILALIVNPLLFILFIAGWLIIMIPIGLWIPPFYRSLEYAIDGESVRGRKGVFWRKHVTVPYPNVTNVDVTQGPLQRMFNVGTIHVQTAGAAGSQGGKAELRLLGIRELDEIKDRIMERASGYADSGKEKVRKDVLERSDSELLRHILQELIAIREALEKRPS